MLLIGEVGMVAMEHYIPRHTDTHSFKCLFFFFFPAGKDPVPYF